MLEKLIPNIRSQLDRWFLGEAKGAILVKQTTLAEFIGAAYGKVTA